MPVLFDGIVRLAVVLALHGDKTECRLLSMTDCWPL